MRSLEELETAWATGAPMPRDAGVVRLLVRRTAPGVHDTPERVVFTVEDGVTGDRWAVGKREPLAQVTVMSARAATLVCGDHQPLDAPGDNVLVDLDLSEDALPVGARLRVGSAVLEVTDEPHMGCSKFRARFGGDALRWVNAKSNRALRLRGVNTRVIQAGTARVGDPVTVER